MANDSLTSVHRALNVLTALGSGPLGVQAVAEELGTEKTQISRTLKVLASEGFVERDPRTLEYSLGWRIFALAAAGTDSRLRRNAAKALRGLTRELGEPAYLTVREGSAALTVLSEQSGRGIQAHEWIGRASPLNCTSSGRALLLGLEADEVTDILSGCPTPWPGIGKAPRTVAAVLKRLRQEQRTGYVVSAEEYEVGLTAVAAPILGFQGTPVAAVNVSMPSFRLTPDGLQRVIAAVTAAAAGLSSNRDT
ncbi:IclR family transcriptional regulator [Amycolatopsis acidiphila]|uniref:IclR family transcriptional regulator n=1 Tax=Amycolatopsis acidiphila TaxID=715473 RepID=A0A558A4N0_9PSEU|nr:IclR family transcriptional regulator [Amycolatopsis acidiphila]TVT19213.1 IclR family transcriptional regulator [Amycolatopsis acidiphila]UIJ62033.1 IclR family transcriptional regulator [Amycolatopsis acidiphila]GHG56533.1 IclR family transcriptional regulator [Amycolatopsis acidiphila]